MLTIFTIPKPFADHIGIIQRNAIRSWSRLQPCCQIILCGDEIGIREAAAECEAEWIPAIARNAYGTPLLDSAFQKTIAAARHERICYINADIILMDDFLQAVARIRHQRFLMVGQRWDVALDAAWNFNDAAVEERLRDVVGRQGTLHPPSGSDYFVFPRRSWIKEFPPFAVGRPGWDNWVIYAARKQGIPVIDATRATTVIHQKHDYGHVPARRSGIWEGPEADRNRELVGGPERLFTLLDATHIMTASTIRRAIDPRHLRRYVQTLPILKPVTRPLWHGLNLVGRWVGSLARSGKWS